jgi:hypothetical protein
MAITETNHWEHWAAMDTGATVALRATDIDCNLLDGSSKAISSVPLIQHLTNGQFGQSLVRLAAAELPADQYEEGDQRRCGCGCGATVISPRKFLNQEHYSARLRQVRYVGRNRRPEIH